MPISIDCRRSHLADAVRGDDSFPRPGLTDGLAAIQTLRAIQLSVQTGEAVTVADVTGAI